LAWTRRLILPRILALPRLKTANGLVRLTYLGARRSSCLIMSARTGHSPIREPRFLQQAYFGFKRLKGRGSIGKPRFLAKSLNRKRRIKLHPFSATIGRVLRFLAREAPYPFMIDRSRQKPEPARTIVMPGQSAIRRPSR